MFVHVVQLTKLCSYMRIVHYVLFVTVVYLVFQLSSGTSHFQHKQLPPDAVTFQEVVNKWKITGSSISKLDTINTDNPWFIHGNVCIDGSDGLKFFESPNSTTRQSTYLREAVNLGAMDSGLHARPHMLNISEYIDSERKVPKVHILDGNSVIVRCSRVAASNPHVAHFWFGVGALFQFMLFAHKSKRFSPLADIVVHQCPSPYDGEYIKFLWNITLKFGMQKRVITPATRFHLVNNGDVTSLFCFDRVYDNNWNEYPSFPYTDEEVKTFAPYFRKEATSYLTQTQLEDVQQISKSDTTRIGIYIREQTARARRIQNTSFLEDRIRAKFKHAQIVFIDGIAKDTPIYEVMQKMNSFDILISPPGSHLNNVLFSFFSPKVIIEVSSVCANTWYQRWFPRIGVFYINSEGHGSEDPKLQKLAKGFTDGSTPRCWRKTGVQVQAWFKSSVTVEWHILEHDIELALGMLQVAHVQNTGFIGSRDE